MINALIAKFKSQRVRGQQNNLPLKTDSDASETKNDSPATHQDTPRFNQNHAAEEPGVEPDHKNFVVELVLPNSFSLLSEDKSPKISAQPSATHDPMGKLSKDDVLKYAPIVISLLALTTTVVIAAYQTGISSSLRDLSVLTNHQALEAKDLSLMSGISVDITEGKVILNNLGTTAVTNAGYWAVHTAEDTYTDYMSQTTPIPGRSSMTFDLSTLPQQPASLKSVVLAFQVPSGDWWSVSDIGLLEKSPSSRTADWTEAAENLKSFKLQADTVMEGFGSHQTVTVDGVTGPIPNIEAYVTENGTSGISALITKSPCA